LLVTVAPPIAITYSTNSATVTSNTISRPFTAQDCRGPASRHNETGLDL
jgi:hypothetical protein